MPVVSSSKTYDCELCGAALPSKWALDNHLCIFHDVCSTVRTAAQITFRCAACGAGFARRSELLEHMKSAGHGGTERRDDVVAPGRRGARGAPGRKPRRES